MKLNLKALNELGVSYRQLDFWVSQGYLKCRYVGGVGVKALQVPFLYRWGTETEVRSSGTVRDFEPGEERVLRRMAALVSHGYRPEAAARIARRSGHVYIGAGIHMHLQNGNGHD